MRAYATIQSVGNLIGMLSEDDMVCCRLNPLVMFRGATKRWTITIRREVDDEPIDITAATALEFQVKTVPGAADPPLISKAIGTGVTIQPQTGDTLGQAIIALDGADTNGAGTPAGLYHYDVVLVLGGERHYVIAPSEFWLRDVVNP